jgi:pre-mRNA-splicing helicase BRR2
MSEDFVRQRQYEYRQNSNLVLEPEREGRRTRDEATGEVESFAQIGIKHSMGDLVRRGGRDLDKKLQKSRTKRSAASDLAAAGKSSAAKKRSRNEAATAASSGGGRGGGARGGASVLTETQDQNAGYRPKTKLTRAAYEALLAQCARRIGDVPDDILSGAADEVLAVLKDSAASAKVRQAGVEEILGIKLPTEQFNDLVNIGTLITDYSKTAASGGGGGGDDAGESESDSDDGKGDAGGGKIDENLGVAVVFDEDDDEDEEDRDVDEVRDGDDDDDDDEDDDDDRRRVEARSGVTLTGAADDDIQERDRLDLDVKVRARAPVCRSSLLTPPPPRFFPPPPARNYAAFFGRARIDRAQMMKNCWAIFAASAALRDFHLLC